MNVEFPGIVFIFLNNAVKNILRIIHQIHFVNRHNQMGNLQQGNDKAVSFGLGQNAVAGIHQNDGTIRLGSACHHVSGVLNMTRRVSNDEFSFRRLKITVGHIDGDALLSFRRQSIQEISQFDILKSLLPRRFLNGRILIIIDGFCLVQEPANQRRFAVIYAAGRCKTQQRFFTRIHQKYPSFFFCSMELSLVRSITRFSLSDFFAARTSPIISSMVVAEEGTAPVQGMQPRDRKRQ